MITIMFSTKLLVKVILVLISIYSIGYSLFASVGLVEYIPSDKHLIWALASEIILILCIITLNVFVIKFW